MKLLFIDPPWYSLQGMSSAPVPLGLGYLATYLEKFGHTCLIFSGEVGISKKIRYQKVVIGEEDSLKNLMRRKEWQIVVKKLLRLLNDFNPKVVGITMPTAKYKIVLELVKLIKKNSEAKIILGGPHPTILPEDAANIRGVDFIVRGEGEETLKELIKSIEKNEPIKNIKGISYKKNGRVFHNPNRTQIHDLDSLPFPNWDLLYEHEKMPRNHLGTIISSRGCPYQCIFCASKRIWGAKVRFRSPENVFKEITEKNRKYRIDLFNFNDDSFTLKKENVLKLCNMIIKGHIKINWKCDTRADLISYKLLKKMKDAGCVKISFGIECGNDKMLNYIKKGITIKQVIEAFKITKKLGIGTMAYFMMGFPNETRKDIYDAVKLMKKIKPSHPCWSIATPYPGTELYEICEKEGLIKGKFEWDKFHHHSNKMGFSRYINREEFIKLAKKIEKITFRMKLRYYLTHPKILSKELKII